MIFAQYYLDCLSQASYLIADETSRRAVVVDPRRDVAEYVQDARARGLTIEGVINTHFHADFVSGHLELAAATGAWIGYCHRAETEYPTRALRERERISLGEVTLEILETPGHTPESISIVVYEHADDEVPYAVLTGDTLFIGDVGRPDLLASTGFSAEELGTMLYDSVHNKLMRLPDATRVFPAHGAGSACGKNLSTERQSTIGAQRATNYACRSMDVDRFLTVVTAGQGTAPSYFSYDADFNRRRHQLLDTATQALSASMFITERDSGATVIDTRDPAEFARGHLRGSLNVPLDGRFAETAGTVLDPETKLAIIAPDGREQETAIRLARVGFDAVLGYLADGEAALLTLADQVDRASRLTTAELTDVMRRGEPPVILDVRNTGELEQGRIEGSLHIPLAELPQRITEVPTGRPIVVHCAGGYRSSVAASFLRRAIVGSDISDLIGGYSAYHLVQRV